MKTRYWFTNDNGDNLGNDFVGTLEGAINHAKIIALMYKQDIAINEGEDIIDWVYYEELVNNGYEIKPVVCLGEDYKMKTYEAYEREYNQIVKSAKPGTLVIKKDLWIGFMVCYDENMDPSHPAFDVWVSTLDERLQNCVHATLINK